MKKTDISALIQNERVNAVLSWIVIFILGTLVVESALTLDIRWTLFTTAVLLLAVAPAIKRESFRTMVPWELLTIAALPLVGRALEYSLLVNRITVALSLAAVALLISVEVHMFTSVKMTTGFAIFFVFITTLAATGFWNVLLWFSDLYLKTSFLANNEWVMLNLVAAGGSGILAGIFFDRYGRRHIEQQPEEGTR